MEKNIEPYKNKQQIADFFGVSIRTVERWVSAGCPHITIGAIGCNRRRFQVSDVNEWLITQKTVSAR